MQDPAELAVLHWEDLEVRAPTHMVKVPMPLREVPVPEELKEQVGAAVEAGFLDRLLLDPVPGKLLMLEQLELVGAAVERGPG
jgi:hypothetical protein